MTSSDNNKESSSLLTAVYTNFTDVSCWLEVSSLSKAKMIINYTDFCLLLIDLHFPYLSKYIYKGYILDKILYNCYDV